MINRKITDEEALLEMKKKLDLIFEHQELKIAVLENLQRIRESWANLKQ